MTFQRDRHIRYFLNVLKELPSPYSRLDTNRMTLVHFAVQSLDLINALDHPSLDRDSIIEWIYSLQTLPSSSKYDSQVGFKGGTYAGSRLVSLARQCDFNEDGWEYDHGHVAMTYTALATLAALGDDLSRVERKGIVKGLRYLQGGDGSFRCVGVGSENDMRFLYCACAISHMLNDWSGVDIDAAVQFIKNCRSYDGGIGLYIGQEGHGGSTFCGIASLALMGRLKDVLDEEDGAWREDLIGWCVRRQIGGMQGRPNKVEDTCYSYWVGGTLRLLDADSLIDRSRLVEYVLSCQTSMGGFGKVLGAFPDLLHSFYSIAWLSLSGEVEEMNKLDCVLGMRSEKTIVFEEFKMKKET